MTDPARHRKSRGDDADNVEAQDADVVGTVLNNRKGITDLRTLQREEEAALARASDRLLADADAHPGLTADRIRAVHEMIFGDLYDWAGRWRTVPLSRPGAAWPLPEALEQAVSAFERDVLEMYPAWDLADDAVFCDAAGFIQGEFLAIRPFQEGNVRTIRLITDLLAVQTGRPPLRYDRTEAGRRRYGDAVQAAIQGDCTPLNAVVHAALDAAR